MCALVIKELMFQEICDPFGPVIFILETFGDIFVPRVGVTLEIVVKNLSHGFRPAFLNRRVATW